MKKKVFAIVGIILIAGAAAAGGWYYYKQNYSETASEGTAYVTKISTLIGEETGVMNRFAGVVEAQETVKVSIESGRQVSEVQVQEGDVVKTGQLLFEYDLSSIEEDLKEAELALDRLKNEALSLEEQINTLEKEKKKASSSNQLTYTIEIETNKMNLKKNEYDQISKQAEIEKLQAATTNTEVRSELDGIIQKIDTSKLNSDDGDNLYEGMGIDYGSDSSDSNAFITILSTGAYRIKGKVNEMNKSSVVPGERVIVRSRVDETQIWYGTMGAVDEQNASSDSDDTTSSSSYPFYVELDSSEGLMLGQHVYIEKDEGQEEQKTGIWLSDFYIVDADTENPYVWAADDRGRLEKRPVVLGQYDEELFEYEIADGLTEEDSIAYPSDDLEEGMSTADISEMEDVDPGTAGYDMGTDEEGMIIDGSADSYEDYTDGDVMEPVDGEVIGGSIEEGYVDESMDESFIDESNIDDSYIEDDMEGEAITYDSDDTEAAG